MITKESLYDQLKNRYDSFEEFIQSNMELWRITAEFVGYPHTIMLENVPLFLKKDVPEKFVVDNKIRGGKELEDFMEGNILSSWVPNANYEQAMEVHLNLLKRTAYKNFLIDYGLDSRINPSAKNFSYKNYVAVTYKNTIYEYGELFASGENEAEAICNACVAFYKKHGVPNIKYLE